MGIAPTLRDDGNIRLLDWRSPRRASSRLESGPRGSDPKGTPGRVGRLGAHVRDQWSIKVHPPALQRRYMAITGRSGIFRPRDSGYWLRNRTLAIENT